MILWHARPFAFQMGEQDDDTTSSREAQHLRDGSSINNYNRSGTVAVQLRKIGKSEQAAAYCRNHVYSEMSRRVEKERGVQS